MEIVFYLHASLAVIAMAFAMTLHHTVHALLSMIFSLLCLASAMYALSAPLASGLLVIVYAGAIMVLFAFAIMLLQIPAPNQKPRPWPKERLFFGFVAFIVSSGELAFILKNGLMNHPPLTAHEENLAEVLFLKYGFLLELSSMLLLAGLAGAIYVGRQFMLHGLKEGGEARDSH